MHLDGAGLFRRRAKLALYGIGTVIFIASLAYLGLRIVGQWHSLRNAHIDCPGWLAASIAIYGVSHISTGLAWPNALRAIGQRISLRDGLMIALVSQVGKYLPGNVAHYFGRAALGKSVGITFRGSGVSTIIEIACALAAALFLALGLLIVGEASQFSIAFLFGFAAAGTIAAVSIRKNQPDAKFAYVAGFFAAALCITTSLSLSGASAYCLLVSIGAPTPPLTFVVGAFALAWLAGFLTPVAPGGLGVRETVFVGLLSSHVGAAPALACAILHRVVTAIVDCAAAVIGYAWLAAAARSKT
jgi:uncharacterized membrane protein YbhN (UPF0104 family)